MTSFKKSQTARSLVTTLVLAFLTLSVGVLVVSGGLQIFFNLQTQQEAISDKQQVVAHEAASTVASFVQEKFSVLETAIKLANPTRGTPETQQQILDSLLGLQPAFRQLVLFDAQDQELVTASRLALAASEQFVGQLTDLLPQTQRQRYISPVYVDPKTSEPMVIIAIPAISVFGDFEGTLAAEVNLKFMWDLVDRLREAETGRQAYVVDREGNLLAFWDSARVLKGENVSRLKEVEEFINNSAPVDETGATIASGIEGHSVMGTYVPLGMPDWAVVTELPVEQAYQAVIRSAVISVGVMLAMSILAGLSGVYVARRLAAPLLNLTQTPGQIANGEMDLRAPLEGSTEVVNLAKAFNTMTAQLQDLIGSLEQRVADRTQALEQRSAYLEASAKVGRTASSILEANELIRQVVELIRERFGLYYVGLFEVDPAGEWAVLRAGTGMAGQAMLARQHQLKIGGESMIGWCIANAEARITQTAEEDAFHSATPELPETRAEAALPLRSRGQIIGALTVQSDQPGAFEEATITVLQTLADQVAVALTNAHLFAQAQQRTAEAEAASQALTKQMWQTAGQAQLGDRMRGELTIPALADRVIQQLCHYLEAQVGVLYIADAGFLRPVGSYAYAPPNDRDTRFKLGEGLVGQAALERRAITLSDVPEDYLIISFGLGEAVPQHIVVVPFLYEEEVIGVVALGTLAAFTPAQVEFLEMAMANIGIAFNTADARARIDELLVETQRQAEELQAQSEELQTANEELQTQADSLKRSEAALREKQVELEEANTELEEKATALQQKQIALDRQNQELKVAQAELEEKAHELTQASKYKSEFLANMSHELRTPLNSLLILAGMLKQNEDGNLTADQVESAEVIHNSGRDLLELINEILDLSKIEAGHMEFHFEPITLRTLTEAMAGQFVHVAEEQGLEFTVTLADELPPAIKTDQQRVKQIVKNLLSNAFKFTKTGSVSLNVHRPATLPTRFAAESGLKPDQALAISVIDTGIGIAQEQQQIVFEAFQQVEGGTSRQYGGTGLGLSISRELSTRLGGYIALQSELGKGSTFTLYLPLSPAVEEQQDTRTQVQRWEKPVRSSPPITTAEAEPSPPEPMPDDRDDLSEGDKVVLIIEDDADFAQIVHDFAHEKDFKCLLAGDGETGLMLAKTYRPDAIVLDLYLPRMDGWQLLAALKDSPDTRHIPVHIMSADSETLDAYKRGAMDFLTKPISPQDLEETFQKIEAFIEREIKTLLLIEDEESLRRSIKKLLGGSDVQISEAGTGQAALDLLHTQHFDCMILDLSLPDISGFEVLNRMDENESITKCPVIVYTGRDLTPEENLELTRYADSVIVKGVKSPERLLDETALFLHRLVADMPEDKQKTIKRLHDKEALLTDKKILLVDDDTRSAFALSKLLADKGIKMSIARDGQQALDFLAKSPNVDLVLMDVMMPVMDGYETTRRIRAQQQFATLPILALTAKAMMGDREKCLEAGANDYLAKPIDAERLFSMLRVWLYQ